MEGCCLTDIMTVISLAVIIPVDDFCCCFPNEVVSRIFLEAHTMRMLDHGLRVGLEWIMVACLKTQIEPPPPPQFLYPGLN